MGLHGISQTDAQEMQATLFGQLCHFLSCSSAEDSSSLLLLQEKSLISIAVSIWSCSLTSCCTSAFAP